MAPRSKNPGKTTTRVDEAETVRIRCTVTGEEREVRRLKSGNAAIPRGWKRVNGKFYSGAAWRKQFVLRTIRVPVAGVLGSDGSPDANRERWSQLRSALQLSWRQATHVSNWMMTELAKLDSAPLLESDNGPKLPKFPTLAPILRQLYDQARERWPELDSQSFCSLRQRVVAKYLEIRFDLRCRASMSLPNYRYPTPLPIPAKDATFFEEDSQVCVRVRVSGNVFRLRLRAGREFRRANTILRKVVQGELLNGELSLLERAAGGARYQSSKDGVTRQSTRLMLHVPVWVPREPLVSSTKTCSVRSTSQDLWSVAIDGESEAWQFHEDQIIRWTRAYQTQLNRLREDARTMPASERARLGVRRKQLRVKFQRRIEDASHKLAARLTALCKRKRVGIVNYNDEDKQWLPDFAWYDLRQLCQSKIEAAGMRFHYLEAEEGEASEAVGDVVETSANPNHAENKETVRDS